MKWVKWLHKNIIIIIFSILKHPEKSISFHKTQHNTNMNQFNIDNTYSGGIFDPFLILYICRLTKKWWVYHFNGRFILTVRGRITTKKIQKNAVSHCSNKPTINLLPFLGCQISTLEWFLKDWMLKISLCHYRNKLYLNLHLNYCNNISQYHCFYCVFIK